MKQKKKLFFRRKGLLHIVRTTMLLTLGKTNARKTKLKHGNIQLPVCISQGVRHSRNLVRFSWKPGESPRIPMDFRGIPQNPQKPHAFHSTESLRVPVNPRESSGIPWNPQETPGILQNPKNPQNLSFYTSGNLVRNLRSVEPLGISDVLSISECRQYTLRLKSPKIILRIMLKLQSQPSK